MKRYEMFELQFEGAEPAGSKAQVDLKAVFQSEGKSVEVDGFYAGDGIYKVRFYPRQTGHYQWRITGVVQAEGEFLCEASVDNRGMVRADGLHFRYDNGNRYLPFGTTVYALLHQDTALIDQTMRTLKSSPFNKVRLCVFPKHYDYNQNEPEFFAFDKKDGAWDVHSPCTAFWDALEKRIWELHTMGIEADLILFHPYDKWGFSSLTKEECMVYLDYAARRLSAFPNIWWSLANEFDLMHHFKREWWADFAAFLNSHDPYGHLLSNHNCIGYWDFHNPHTTHCCIQDVNVWDVEKLQQTYKKPVVFDECCYEGNVQHAWGNISAFEMAHRFWTASVCGGYCTHGETYLSDDDVLWWGKGGVLKGYSPDRIGFLREILESLPGPLCAIPQGISAVVENDKHDNHGDTDVGGNAGSIDKQPEMTEEMKMFAQLIMSLPEAHMERFMVKIKTCAGHVGDKAYLYYYGRQCPACAEIVLPEDGEYLVESIDIWDMKREELLYKASGKVKLKLPGKEGIAVLARKMDALDRPT